MTQAIKLVFAAVPFTSFLDLIGRRGIGHMGASSVQDDIESYELEHQTAMSYASRPFGELLTTSVRMLVESTGITIERVDNYRVSVGFQHPEPDERVFTERDIEVFTTWNGFVDSGAIDLATSCSLLRANSHLADRLSLWQFEALVEDAIRRLGPDDTTARMHTIDHMRDSVHAFERMLPYSQRHQMETLLVRLDKEVAQRGHEDSCTRSPLNRSLGFADMMPYTSSSTILGGVLMDPIERFEEESRLAVTEAGGRIVKTIGGAVPYIADDLATEMKVATSLIEHLSIDDTILPVRAFFVRGDVFSRPGDVSGPTINLASRLMDIAPMGKILTDLATAATIVAGKARNGYVLEDFPSAELWGFGQVTPYALSSRD